MRERNYSTSDNIVRLRICQEMLIDIFNDEMIDIEKRMFINNIDALKADIVRKEFFKKYRRNGKFASRS